MIKCEDPQRIMIELPVIQMRRRCGVVLYGGPYIFNVEDRIVFLNLRAILYTPFPPAANVVPAPVGTYFEARTVGRHPRRETREASFPSISAQRKPGS